MEFDEFGNPIIVEEQNDATSGGNSGGEADGTSKTKLGKFINKTKETVIKTAEALTTMVAEAMDSDGNGRKEIQIPISEDVDESKIGHFIAGAVEKGAKLNPLYQLLGYEIDVTVTSAPKEPEIEFEDSSALLEWEQYNSYAGVPTDYRDDLILREMEEEAAEEEEEAVTDRVCNIVDLLEEVENMPAEMHDKLNDITEGDKILMGMIWYDYQNEDPNQYISQGDDDVKEIPYNNNSDIWNSDCGVADDAMALRGFGIATDDVTNEQLVQDLVNFIEEFEGDICCTVESTARLPEFLEYIKENGLTGYNTDIDLQVAWPRKAQDDLDRGKESSLWGEAGEYGPELDIAVDLMTDETKDVYAIMNTKPGSFNHSANTHFIILVKVYQHGGKTIVHYLNSTTDGRTEYEAGLGYITLEELKRTLDRGITITYTDK